MFQYTFENQSIAIAICIFLFYQAFLYTFDPLRRVQGPNLARFTRLWYLKQIYDGKFHETNIKLHRKYGKVARIGPNIFSIDDLDAAKVIYGHGNKFTKSDWYQAWSAPAVDKVNLFSLQDTKQHASVRRQLSQYYSMSSLVKYEPYVDECISIFTQRLSEFADTGANVNICHWLQCYAFDVIANITFAKRFGFLDRGADIGGMINALEFVAAYASMVGIFPMAHKLLVRMAGSGPMGFILQFTNDAIKERKLRKDAGEKSTIDTPDFLSKYLVAHEDDPERFPQAYITAACAANVFAGSDTTGITLSSILYHLLVNPATYAKLKTEIDTADANGEISDPITFGEAQNLKYLQAVLKEALRIHSVVGLPLVRRVPMGGAILAGTFFPEGTTVGINPWVAHMNVDVFGSDADQFNPERWIENDTAYRKSPSQLGAMDQYFMPFGLGSRTCIGKNISLLEISKLVPQMVRKFKFNMTLYCSDACNHWFVKQKGFEVTVKVRENGENKKRK